MVAHLFFFSEDESSLNKTPKAITGPEQQLLESMVLEENIGEEFCRDGPQIAKKNLHQPLGSKRKQREKEKDDGRRTKDNNVKRSCSRQAPGVVTCGQRSIHLQESSV